MRELESEIAALNAVHASLSPVLVLQSAARAKLARADAADRRAAAPAEKPAAPPTAPTAPAAAPPAAVDDASAAARIQRSYRGKARAESAAAGAKAAELEQMYASLGASAVFSMPYLYVQRRHLDETHALLATALGDDAQHTTVEDTRCFVVRPAASHVPNATRRRRSAAVVRRRAPRGAAATMRPTARAAAALARRRARGRRARCNRAAAGRPAEPGPNTAARSCASCCRARRRDLRHERRRRRRACERGGVGVTTSESLISPPPPPAAHRQVANPRAVESLCKVVGGVGEYSESSRDAARGEARSSRVLRFAGGYAPACARRRAMR